MPISQIFSDTLDPASVNLSDPFLDAVGFYVSTPFLEARGIEFGIDVFLQVYLNNTVRNLPLGRISESAIILNQADTETLASIPEEFLDTGLECRLLFLPSEAVYLEAFAIAKNISLADIQAELKAINAQLNAGLLNELAQNAALIGLGTSAATALAPITGGLSAAIAPAVSTPLLTGTTAIEALPGFG